MKRFIEMRKRRISVDQHQVQKLICEHRRTVVVFLLVHRSTAENISQTTDDERTSFVRVCCFEQRTKLDCKLLPTEWKQLEHNDSRSQIVEACSNHFLAAIERALDRDSFVVTDELICFVDSEWWQVDDLDARGNDESLGHATAIQQHHSKALGQTVGKRQGTHKMAHGQGVLAVKQEGGSGRHWLITYFLGPRDMECRRRCSETVPRSGRKIRQLRAPTGICY